LVVAACRRACTCNPGAVFIGHSPKKRAALRARFAGRVVDAL